MQEKKQQKALLKIILVLKDLLVIMERIDQTGAGFESLMESINTTPPAGRMMMHMVGSFTEFEREMIRERTREQVADLVPLWDLTQK